MDQTSSSIGGDLPDVSSLSFGDLLTSEDTVLARCLARIRHEMASDNEVIAAGFQSAIAMPEVADERHGVASAVRSEGREPL